MESPAARYATRPERTEAGAIQILQREITEALEARQLVSHLLPDFSNSAPDRETLELLELRLQEARLLAARL